MNAEPFNGGFPDIASAWMLLQRQILLKPIRSEADYQRMLRLASQLTAQINGNADSPLADLVGVVKDLIQVWETHRVSLPKLRRAKCCVNCCARMGSSRRTSPTSRRPR